MDDSTAGCIELEYIVVDLVREKRLELVNVTHVLGLNSLLSLSLAILPLQPSPSPIVLLLATSGCLLVCCVYSLESSLDSGVSKWLPKWYFTSLQTVTALSVARAFVDQWVYIYGPPVSLLTDNGPQFTAKFFQAACAELWISKVLTMAYHPQTNGQVER
jgi:hypothetical protein